MSELVASLWTPEYRMTLDKTLAWKIIDDQLIYIRAVDDELLSKNKKVTYLGSQLKVGEVYVLEDTKEKFIVFSGNDPVVDRELSFDTTWLPEDARYIGDIEADDYLCAMRVPFNKTGKGYTPIVWNLGGGNHECHEYFYDMCFIDILESKLPAVDLENNSKSRYVTFGITTSYSVTTYFCYNRNHIAYNGRLDNFSSNFPISAYYSALKNENPDEFAKTKATKVINGEVDDLSTATTLVRSMSVNSKGLLGAAALAGSASKGK